MIKVDSRKVQKGDIFVAIKGFAVDGHNYALDAEKNGAIKVYCEHHIDNLTIPQEIVTNSREFAGKLASDFFGNPSEKIKLIGVTGTNGKTTTTYMIKSILEQVGEKVGLIGTNQNMIGSEILHTDHTTPESTDLQELLYEMHNKDCKYVVMEVSSHALALDRIAGSKFAIAAFTNLTQDHLDFHKNFEDYFNAKCKLFDIAEKSVINIDNEWGKKLLKICEDNAKTKSCKTNATNLSPTIHHPFPVSSSDITFPLPPYVVGKFNLENAAVALGVCRQLNIPEKQIIKGLQNFKGVCGRMEVVYDNDFKIIIDYAHTPDGLKNILKTAREFTKGRLIILFGCGGDRDAKKRPLMGKVASELADICVVTSDNPRTENPKDIINEILIGMVPGEKIIIENRLDAIKHTINHAQKNDVIILAGKGHEDYQIIGKEKVHFDEHEIVRDIIGKIKA